MARVFTSPTHWGRASASTASLGVNPDAEQTARSYMFSVLGFSLVSIVVLFAILIGQAGAAVQPRAAGNAVGDGLQHRGLLRHQHQLAVLRRESTLGFTAQMVGLAVQNFASAAVGIAVAAALIRGFARRRSDEVGNFWVDLVADHPAAPAAALVRRRDRC